MLEQISLKQMFLNNVTSLSVDNQNKVDRTVTLSITYKSKQLIIVLVGPHPCPEYDLKKFVHVLTTCGDLEVGVVPLKSFFFSSQLDDRHSA